MDGLDPMAVFCNMSSTPVTAVLHHNLEEWTEVGDEYDEAFSFNGEVGLLMTCPFISIDIFVVKVNSLRPSDAYMRQ